MDELEILNNALINTGNSILTVLNDGSDEWQAASRAFDRSLDDLISQHGWPFARKSADLVKAPDADNPSQEYDYAHRLPTDLLHLKRVFYTSGTQKIPTTQYIVMGRLVCLNEISGVAAEYIALPADTAWHPQAIEVLTIFVEVGCLRGLNEDFDEARRRESDGLYKLSQVRQVVDSENPPRQAFQPRMSRIRRTRRG